MKEKNIKWPDYNNCIANLPNSILKKFGIDSEGQTLAIADKLLEKDYKNIVVLLLDGMGINILEGNLDPEGFFRKHLVSEYSSVFPPTTVAATTSIDTGRSPIEHAWLGWDCYYPQLDKNVTVFLNAEQVTAIPAADFPVASTYCGYESVISKLNVPGVKAYYASPFVAPYPRTFDAVLSRIKSLCAQDGPKYIYGYCNEPDNNMHQFGCFADSTRIILRDLEKKIEAFAEQLEDTLLIITADHGHIDSKCACLDDYPEIADCLLRNPSIEPRALNLFIKPGRKEAFEKAFAAELGDKFILFTKEEVLEKKIFGEGPLHPNVSGMIGDYLAVATGDLSLFNTPEEKAAYIGVHAGLTKEEMIIPLIAIER